MSGHLKIILRLALIILILIIGSAVLIAYLNEDKIRALAIEQINQALDTEVKVESIEFSLLRKFPKASIHFKNINILEKSNRKEPQNLLEAQSLFLQFDPLDLLTGTYTIDQVHAENAIVRVTYYKDGTDNFHFFKSDSSSNDFKISLSKVTLKNSNLIYSHLKWGDEIRSDISSLTFSGDFERSVYDLNIDAKGLFNKLMISRFKLRDAHLYSLKLKLGIDHQSKRYSLNMASLQLGEILIGLDGFFQTIEGGTEMDISFIGNDTKLAALKEVFPLSWRDKIEEYNAKGIVDIRGNLSGAATASSNPSISLTFNLQNGQLIHRKSNLKAEKISFRGKFNNGKSRSKRTSVFAIDTLSFKGIQGPTHGKLKISNFDAPILQFSASSVFELENIKELIGNDSVELLHGNCILDVAMKTSLDSLSSISAKNLKRAKISGSIELKEVYFKYTGMPHAIEKANGVLHFNSNAIESDSFSCVISKNELNIAGRVLNLIPFIIYKNEHLSIAAEIQSPRLNIDNLLTTDNDVAEGNFALPLSKNLTLGIKVQADTLLFRKFHAYQLTANVTSRYPELYISSLHFNAMEGTYDGWAKVEQISNKDLFVRSELHLKHVDINSLFSEFENFGQSSIKAENLMGYADINLNFESRFSPSFEVYTEQIKAWSSVEIKNGELLNYEPVLALSKYVDVEELNHIKFSKLSNEIEIKESTVIIPQMNVKSSALELSFSGLHRFNNEIEYHFQLYLNDFLFKKAKRSKKNQSEFGEIEPDESGRAKIYVRMEGNVDEYKIRLDRKVLREKWNDELNEERQVLKELFREEFKGDKKEEKIEPMDIGIEWEGQEETSNKKDSSRAEDEKIKDKKKKKSLLEKIGGDNEDEYETYDPNKFD